MRRQGDCQVVLVRDATTRANQFPDRKGVQRILDFINRDEGLALSSGQRRQVQHRDQQPVGRQVMRNFLRQPAEVEPREDVLAAHDEIQVGDRAFFYHSGVPPLAIVGTVEVINPAYPDPTAFDPSDHHYDPKSSRENPTWYAVDIKLLTRFPEPVSRDDLKGCRELRDMMLLQRGSRLSVQPVTMAEWTAVHRLVGIKDM